MGKKFLIVRDAFIRPDYLVLFCVDSGSSDVVTWQDRWQHRQECQTGKQDIMTGVNQWVGLATQDGHQSFKLLIREAIGSNSRGEQDINAGVRLSAVKKVMVGVVIGGDILKVIAA